MGDSPGQHAPSAPPPAAADAQSLPTSVVQRTTTTLGFCGPRSKIHTQAQVQVHAGRERASGNCQCQAVADRPGVGVKQLAGTRGLHNELGLGGMCACVGRMVRACVCVCVCMCMCMKLSPPSVSPTLPPPPPCPPSSPQVNAHSPAPPSSPPKPSSLGPPSSSCVSHTAQAGPPAAQTGPGPGCARQAGCPRGYGRPGRRSARCACRGGGGGAGQGERGSRQT